MRGKEGVKETGRKQGREGRGKGMESGVRESEGGRRRGRKIETDREDGSSVIIVSDWHICVCVV